MLIDNSLLNSYVGKPIEQICLNGYADHGHNHCAHFVSHVLNLDFGKTCRALVSERHRVMEGANVRVHEIFARCPRVYEFNSCPAVICGLIFVSKTTSFRTTPTGPELRNVPKKHIGIILNQNIWHYSNTRERVIVQNMAQFINHYRGQRNSLWFGEIPGSANPHPWGMSVAALPV